MAHYLDSHCHINDEAFNDDLDSVLENMAASDVRKAMIVSSYIDDFSRAIELDGNIPEAYYNRGIVYLHAEKKSEGIADLSKAGELGLYDAYSIIKKYREK